MIIPVLIIILVILLITFFYYDREYGQKIDPEDVDGDFP